MAGKDVVDQVLLCPGMCAALQQVLDASPPGHNAGTQQWQGVQGPGAESCSCMAHLRLRTPPYACKLAASWQPSSVYLPGLALAVSLLNACCGL